MSDAEKRPGSYEDQPGPKDAATAIETIGGDASGANTGLKPGEEPIIPRDAGGEALGDDRAVPEHPPKAGHVDVDALDRGLGVPEPDPEQ